MPKGRKDDAGQESVVKHETLATRIDHLITLKRAVESATSDYSDAVKAAAEASGMQSSIVRSFVAARAGERFAERKRDVNQLSICFDLIGE